ncbi:lysoplasmalogenase family protein [Streptomyces sp. NPDC001046]|uniref:lysoplasmalogenase family protein n=1 Tax=Streptomyces sp. NPDC001046 TaxID=3364543 RepID=UPI003687B075
MSGPGPRAGVLLGVFGLAAAVDLAALAVGSGAGHTVAKPLLMPLLAGWAAAQRAPRPLVAALLCGGAGDVLLLSGAEPALLAGTASFAAGHVCYLVLFRAHGSRYAVPAARAAALALGYATVLGATLVLLWTDLPAGLRLPVAAHGLLLTAVAYRSAIRFGLFAGTGGALFLLSGTLVATELAGRPQPPAPGFWVMLTYLAAQALLACGTVAALNARRAPAVTYGEMRAV